MLSLDKVSDDWTDLYKTSLRLIKQEGLIVPIGSNGSTKVHPALQALEKASKFVIKLEEMRQDDNQLTIDEFLVD